jgi:phosphatidylglycerol---prolipoprotein diacylglyceryl transferase
MHPILLRIPLPNRPLKIWWALVAVAVIALLYGAWSQRKEDKQGALGAVLIGIAAGVGAWYFRDKTYEAPFVPIYSYGVMLGLSLVVGWYLTLTLADRDGLPKETMANCYVFTAVAAIVGSRILYIVTNLDEFKTFADVFALRRGGLVAYGGFLGGFVGSWMYLSRHRIRLMPWADVAVPSLASGLLVTRIGCYLFGCDFGTTLPKSAPGWLQKLGTFPHWPESTLDSGQGSPAFVRHLVTHHDKALALNTSLPVHPTQIYESLCGLLLLVLLLWQRKNQKFRGQIFFLFVFGYGVLRFLLEVIRDDEERGVYGPVMAQHVLVPGALLLMALGFTFGIALGIQNERARTAARVLALLTPLAAFVLLKPASFGETTTVQLSTSQWIALLTAVAVSYFYAKFWEEARKNPKAAMSLGLPSSEAVATTKKAQVEDEEDEEEEEAEEATEGAAKAESKPEVSKKPTKTLAEAPAAKRASKPDAKPKAEEPKADEAEDEGPVGAEPEKT